MLHPRLPRALRLTMSLCACAAAAARGAAGGAAAGSRPSRVRASYPPNPGGELWFECRPGSGPCDPKPKWPVTYAMNESVMLMAFSTGLAADGKPTRTGHRETTGTFVPAAYPANRWAIFDIDWNSNKIQVNVL